MSLASLQRVVIQYYFSASPKKIYCIYLFIWVELCYYCSQDGEFVNLLRDYVENSIEVDYKNVAFGSEELQQLKQFLGSALRDVDRFILFYQYRLTPNRLLKFKCQRCEIRT